MKKLFALLGLAILLALFITSVALAECPPWSPCFQVYLPYTYVISEAIFHTPAPTSLPPTQTPKPGVEILPNYSSFVDSLGYLHLVGEVQNNTSNPINFVKINANLFSSNGVLVSTDFGFGRQTVIASNDKTCFDVMFLKEVPSWAYFKFENPNYSIGGIPVTDIGIYEHHGTYLGTSGYEIIGYAINNGSVTHKYVEIIATVYNSERTVLDCDFGYVNADELIPAQTSVFDVLLALRENYADVTDYRLQADY